MQLLYVQVLRIRWLNIMQQPELDRLSKICPDWGKITVSSGTQKRLYIRVREGDHFRVLCKSGFA
jgi:hypothetical protein